MKISDLETGKTPKKKIPTAKAKNAASKFEISDSSSHNVLRRYTNLASVIHILQQKKITLLNPATWDDKNDAYFMAEFKAKSKAETVLALCFTTASETYHHWRVFANGADGVRIEFEKDKLLEAFAIPSLLNGKKNANERILTAEMKYELIKDLSEKETIPLGEVPFLKRAPFKPEKEFRVVYVNMKETHDFKDFQINVSWIRRITLSPWVSDSLKKSIVKTLRSIKGCENLSITKTTLIDNSKWRALVEKIE